MCPALPLQTLACGHQLVPITISSAAVALHPCLCGGHGAISSCFPPTPSLSPQFKTLKDNPALKQTLQGLPRSFVTVFFIVSSASCLCFSICPAQDLHLHLASPGTTVLPCSWHAYICLGDRPFSYYQPHGHLQHCDESEIESSLCITVPVKPTIPFYLPQSSPHYNSITFNNNPITIHYLSYHLLYKAVICTSSFTAIPSSITIPLSLLPPHYSHNYSHYNFENCISIQTSRCLHQPYHQLLLLHLPHCFPPPSLHL